MIKLHPIKQTRGYCGPASLKIVMDYYGIKKSQNYWAKLTKTSRINGCHEINILKAIRKFGFNGKIKQNSSIKELRHFADKKIPLIVDWFSPEEEGHYSVVSGFEKNKIILADPHFGKIKKHLINWFEERWFDILNKKKLIREIIIITKK